MSFNDITIKDFYRTSDDDIINDFLIPILKNAKKYKRAVGFFSSTALIELSIGISGLIKNGGNIKLVVSPNLSKEDIEAIKTGYLNREKIIEERLMNSLNDDFSETERDRLNLMVSLIEKGIIDIKVATLDFDTSIGMYHEKFAVLEDEEGNKIAFNGSYNESLNSYLNNFESLDVYTTMNLDYKKVKQKEADFENLWNNTTNKLIVMDFPTAVKEKLFEKYYDKNKLLSEDQIVEKEKKVKHIYPAMPTNYLRDYQNKAIEEWKNSNYVGVFDMATGTGKTKTAIGAAIKLLGELNNNLAIVIICPYTHLVEQWIDDLDEFSFSPIMGYGSMGTKKWKDRFKDAILNFKLGIRKYFCFITTNATYCSAFVQNELKKIQDKNVLFIADEAHNLGAPLLQKNLNTNFKYRLALSATFERYNDEVGTKKIFEYFGEKYCIHYGLREAIDNGMLTEYKYYPIIVYLNEEELDDYIFLTHKISQSIASSKDKEMNETTKALLLKRAKIVAGCESKNYKVVELLREQQAKNGEIANTLIYCGATTINDSNYDENLCEEQDVKQIDFLRGKIKSELGISVSKFTSTEDQKERKLIKEQFISKDVNVIVAIKCLDEGVNIPSIHTAYILASSTNPREYVQRRGRVLRTAPGKEFATIFDFITLPRKLEEANSFTEEVLKSDLGLVKRELSRMSEFAKDALNFSDSIETRDLIKDVYGKLLFKYGEEIVE